MAKHGTRIVQAILVFTAGTLFTGSAAAEPEFPAAVQEAFGLSCVPTCRLCHVRDEGGFPLASFGEYVQALGGVTRVFTPGKPDTLIEQLRCARDRNCGDIPDPSIYEDDIDGDGVRNIDELAEGSNPTRAGDDSICGAAYGCGARVEPRGTLDTGAAAVTGLALLGVWAATRRARRGAR